MLTRTRDQRIADLTAFLADLAHDDDCEIVDLEQHAPELERVLFSTDARAADPPAAVVAALFSSPGPGTGAKREAARQRLLTAVENARQHRAQAREAADARARLERRQTLLRATPVGRTVLADETDDRAAFTARQEPATTRREMTDRRRRLFAMTALGQKVLRQYDEGARRHDQAHQNAYPEASDQMRRLLAGSHRPLRSDVG